MPIAFTLSASLSELEKQDLYFYPDVFFYDLDEEQYLAEWDKLKQSAGGYLMVREGKLCRVNLFHYYFQRIKGLFGYDNACHADKIVMATMKLSYFGYLNGYKQDNALETIKAWPAEHQPTRTYLFECKSVRGNQTSQNLQRKLMTFYREHSRYLVRLSSKMGWSNHPSSSRYQFGLTYANKKEWDAFTHIDPQDKLLIQTSLPIFPNLQPTLANSTCRLLYVAFQFKTMQEQFEKLDHNQNARLQRWHAQTQALLVLEPHVKLQYLEFIIALKSALAEVDATDRLVLRKEISTLIQTHYSEASMRTSIKQHLLNRKYRLAFSFIEELEKSNPAKALQLIEQNSQYFYGFLQPGHTLSQAYAKSLVKTSTGIKTLFGWVGSGKYIKKAVALDANLAHQDCAPYCFKKLILKRQWQEAYQLLQQRRRTQLPDQDLDISDRRILADNFVEEGNRIYSSARLNRNKDYRLTEEQYHDSLAMIACAVEVIEEEKYVHQLNVHRRLCAQIILATEKSQGYCHPERIELALGYIDAIAQTSCSSVDVHLAATHLDLLIEKIHFLHHLCLDPDTYESGLIADSNHKLQCKNSLSQLILTLDQVIQLWKITPHLKTDPKSCSRYAALLFLKAECLQFFELSGNAGALYKEACDFAPQEPYYRLRYAEFYVDTQPASSEQERDLGLTLLHQQGKSATDYISWFDARWIAKPNVSSVLFAMC